MLPVVGMMEKKILPGKWSRGEVGPVSQSHVVKAFLGCETLRVWTCKTRKSRAALLKWEGLLEVFKGNVSGLLAGEAPL